MQDFFREGGVILVACLPPWPHLSSSGTKLSGAELTQALTALLRAPEEALPSCSRAAAMKSKLSGGYFRGKEVCSVGLRSLRSRSQWFLPDQGHHTDEIEVQDAN